MCYISTKKQNIWLSVGQVCMGICLPDSQIRLSRASGQSLSVSPGRKNYLVPPYQQVTNEMYSAEYNEFKVSNVFVCVTQNMANKM
jgi:hypothetical protein